MVTAFGLLLLMMLVIIAMGRVVRLGEDRAVRRGAARASESRNKALAAVVAVSALLEQPVPAGGGGVRPPARRDPDNTHV